MRLSTSPGMLLDYLAINEGEQWWMPGRMRTPAVDAETVYWYWAPDLRMSINSDGLDPRVNCQELLKMARSVESFDFNQP